MARNAAAALIALLAPGAAAQTAFDEGLIYPTNLNLPELGSQVVVNEGRVAATAPGHQSGGAVFVFERPEGSPWVETHKLPGLDGVRSVALDGDRMVISYRPGFERTESFRFDGQSWNLEAFVEQKRYLTMSLEGDVLAATTSNGSKALRFDGTTWVAEFALLAGQAVLVHGGQLYVGEQHASGPSSHGEVWVYDYDAVNGQWVLGQTLTGPHLHHNHFGASLHTDGVTLVVGAPYEQLPPASSGLPEGLAHVFTRAGGLWTGPQTLAGSGAKSGDEFGFTVGVFGDVMLIGAPGWEDSNAPTALDDGAFYVFERDGPTWKEQNILPSTRPGITYGNRLSQDGFHAALGSSSYSVGGVPENGTINTLLVTGTASVGTSYCTAGTSSNGCTAAVSAHGTPSATASSGFLTVASAAEVGVGLFYFGSNGRQALPWGNGTSFQCVQPPLSRAGLRGTGEELRPCEGVYSQDLNARWCPSCPYASQNPGAGAVTQLQFWYRDPQNTSNQTTSLSDALEFVVTP